MPNAEVSMQVCNTSNILLKYNWHLNLTNKDTIMDLGLQSIKKYKKRAT